MNTTEAPQLRIAFGRFMLESNSYSPIPTTLKDFTHNIEGEKLLKACRPGKWEVKGFLRNMELTGFMKAIQRHKGRKIETIPLLSAWAISGGPMLQEDFELVCTRICRKLKEAAPLDAVFFALHGAMGVVNVIDPEAYLLAQIRETVGPDVKIAITLDMHATLSKGKMDIADIVCGYRTNPHRDFQRTGFKAANLLLRLLEAEIQPTFAWRSLPMLSSGGAGVDFLAPMLPIFIRMNRMENHRDVLQCNIYICHPFLKNPDIGWGVYVLTNNNQELAERLADELAERCWAIKHISYNHFGNIEDTILKARRSFLARKLGTITICDASDVVAAGGTGENTDLLIALLEQGKRLISYIPLRDPFAIEELWDLSVGSAISLEVGGKLHPEFNSPVAVVGTIFTKKDTKSFGRVIVLDLGHVKLVITEGSALALKPSFYKDLGLNAWQPDITVVKSFIHFRLYYFFISRKTFYVQSSGITDLNISHQMETNHPVYPKDEIEDWRWVDAARRAIALHDQRVYFEWKKASQKSV